MDVGDVEEQHAELVAAESRPQVRRAQRVADPGRDRREELVAGGVTQVVVHGLEVIEVEEERGDGPRLAPRVERLLGLVDETTPVRQARERVVEGLVLELGLERAPLLHVVVEHPHDAGHADQHEERQHRGPQCDDREAAVGAGTERDEERPGDHGRRQADEADRAEPRDGDRVWIAQVDHRGMRRGGPEQDVGDEVDAVEPAARDVCLVEVLDRVDLVRHEQRHEAEQQQPERRCAGAWGREQAHRDADEQQVVDRVGEADHERQGVEVGRGHQRLDEERPGQDRDGRRQDGRVEHAAAVAIAEPSPDEQEQADRDERVAGEVQDVGQRGERRLADGLVVVPQDVAGHEQGLPGGHQVPGETSLRTMDGHAHEGHHDGRAADDVVEPALGRAPGLHQAMDDERSRSDGEVRQPER